MKLIYFTIPEKVTFRNQEVILEILFLNPRKSSNSITLRIWKALKRGCSEAAPQFEHFK